MLSSTFDPFPNFARLHLPGKVFIDVNLKEGVQLPLGPAPVPADPTAMDPQVAEQMLVIAHRSHFVKVLELVVIL